VVNDMTNNSL